MTVSPPSSAVSSVILPPGGWRLAKADRPPGGRRGECAVSTFHHALRSTSIAGHFANRGTDSPARRDVQRSRLGLVPGPPSAGSVRQSCPGRPAIADVPTSENKTLVEAIERHAARIAAPDRHGIGTRLGLTAGLRKDGIAHQRCGARPRREGMALLAGGCGCGLQPISHTLSKYCHIPCLGMRQLRRLTGVGWPLNLNHLVPCDGYQPW